MDFSDLKDELEEVRPDNVEMEPLELMAIKLGDIATGGVKLRHVEKGDEDVGERKIDKARRDMLGGFLLAGIEFALEHDLDIERALEERLERMEKVQQQKDMMEKLADAKKDGGDDGLDPSEDRTFM